MSSIKFMPKNILDDLEELETVVEYSTLRMDLGQASPTIFQLKKVLLGIAFVELCILFIVAFAPHLSKASLGESIFIIILLIAVCPATAVVGYITSVVLGFVIEFLRQVLFLGIGKLVIEPQKEATKILAYQKKVLSNYVDLIIGLLCLVVTSVLLIQILLEI